MLLDLGLPDMDGTEVCRRIRAVSQTPIIVVSARDDEIDRVVALEMGADDYVVKPFGMRELATPASVRSRGAPARPSPSSGGRTFGALVVDTRSQKVTSPASRCTSPAKEFELLVYLSADPGAVFRRSEILHDVWDTNWYGTTKTLRRPHRGDSQEARRPGLDRVGARGGLPVRGAGRPVTASGAP